MRGESNSKRLDRVERELDILKGRSTATKALYTTQSGRVKRLEEWADVHTAEHAEQQEPRPTFILEEVEIKGKQYVPSSELRRYGEWLREQWEREAQKRGVVG